MTGVPPDESALPVPIAGEIAEFFRSLFKAPEASRLREVHIHLYLDQQPRALLNGSPGPIDVDAPLSAAETARRLGSGRRWVYDHQHELGVTKQDGRLRFPPDRVEEVRKFGLRHTPPSDDMPIPGYMRRRRTAERMPDDATSVRTNSRRFAVSPEVER